jgi:hypothetical protein
VPNPWGRGLGPDAKSGECRRHVAPRPTCRIRGGAVAAASISFPAVHEGERHARQASDHSTESRTVRQRLIGANLERCIFCQGIEIGKRFSARHSMSRDFCNRVNAMTPLQVGVDVRVRWRTRQDSNL